MKDSSFNADFYFMAATVIPILFLALTLQGTFFDYLLGQAKRRAEVKGLGQKLVSFVALLVAAATFFLGGLGELEAIFALYYRSMAPKRWVLTSLVGLTVIVLGILYWRLYVAATPYADKRRKATTSDHPDSDKKSPKQASGRRGG